MQLNDIFIFDVFGVSIFQRGQQYNIFKFHVFRVSTFTFLYAFSVGSYICLVILAFIFSCLKGTTKHLFKKYYNLCTYVSNINVSHQNMTTYENIKIYSKHSHFSHVFGRFIKPGKVCYWQGPEIPVFYGKFNLLLYSLV